MEERMKNCKLLQRSLGISASVFGLLLCIYAAIPNVVAGEEVKELYSATLLNTSGPSKTIPIKIYVYSYTSDDEIMKFAETLKSGGAEALSKAMDKTSAGRIAPSFGTGNRVNVVRAFDTEKGHLIRMVTNRRMSFMEVTRGGRSTDYEFGILELLVGKDGKAEGSIIGAAQIKFGEKNSIEVESYGIQPLRLLSVSRMK